jgi:hypothetical protein
LLVIFGVTPSIFDARNQDEFVFGGGPCDDSKLSDHLFELVDFVELDEVLLCGRVEFLLVLTNLRPKSFTRHGHLFNLNVSLFDDTGLNRYIFGSPYVVSSDHPDVDLIVSEDTAVISFSVSDMLDVHRYFWPQLVVQSKSTNVDQILFELLSVFWGLYRILLRQLV